jgi:hypothetical protein
MNSLTKYHAKYFAYELTRQLPSNDIGKLTAYLQDAAELFTVKWKLE